MNPRTCFKSQIQKAIVGSRWSLFLSLGSRMPGWRSGGAAKAWRKCSISPTQPLGYNRVVDGSTLEKTAENTFMSSLKRKISDFSMLN